MGFGLWQEQTQKLVMTPELRQAITVLQFSAEELMEYVESKVAENPVIELEQTNWLQIIKLQHEEFRVQRSTPAVEFPMEQMIRASTSLEDTILEQIRLQRVSTEELRLCEYITGHLDSNGYLPLSVKELAANAHVPTVKMERALKRVQACEPTGVGASSLRECLLLQARERGHKDDIVTSIIENHLEDLGNGRFNKMVLALQTTMEVVQQAIAVIRSLDPKPGRPYATERPVYIVPDVAVEKVADEYVVVMNDRVTPRLRIQPVYRKILEAGNQAGGSETKSYVQGKVQDAMWLIKSIEQRRQTLYRVTEALIHFQRDFLDQGSDHLKPLTLRQVAEYIGMHESTVSRATAGKYVQTPRGVFEYRYFFTSGLNTSSGVDASSESIKRKIRTLIQQEDTRDPVSDQKLTDQLQQSGVQISRRTVAKYREELKIPSSKQRKR